MPIFRRVYFGPAPSGPVAGTGIGCWCSLIVFWSKRMMKRFASQCIPQPNWSADAGIVCDWLTGLKRIHASSRGRKTRSSEVCCRKQSFPWANSLWLGGEIVLWGFPSGSESQQAMLLIHIHCKRTSAVWSSGVTLFGKSLIPNDLQKFISTWDLPPGSSFSVFDLTEKLKFLSAKTSWWNGILCF